MSIKVQQDILNHLREKADKPSETKKAASDKLFSSDLKDKLREFGLEVDSEGKRESGKKGTDESEVKKTRLKNGMTVSLKVSKEKLGGEAGEKSAKKIAHKSGDPVSGELVIRDGEKIKARINSAGEGKSVEKEKTSRLSDKAPSDQKDSGEKVKKAAVNDAVPKAGEKSESSEKKSKKGTTQDALVDADGKKAKSSEAESSQVKSKSSAAKDADLPKQQKLKAAEQGTEKGSAQSKKNGISGFQQEKKAGAKHHDGIKGEIQKGKADKADKVDKERNTEGKKSPKGEAKFETTDKKTGNIEHLTKGEKQSSDDKKAVTAAKTADKVEAKAAEGEKVQRTANNSTAARQEPEVRKNGETEQFKTKAREIVKDEDGKERRVPLNRDSARFSRSNVDNSQGAASQRGATDRGQASGSSSGQPVQSVNEAGRAMEAKLKSSDAKNASDESAGKKEDLKASETRAGERLNQTQTQNQFTYIRREVAGKIVEVSRAQQNSSSQSQDGWQRQRIQLGNGQSLDVAVRNSGGRLNIQLGSMNSELARLLQTNIMDLKAHLEEQLSSEVELEFEMQGDQQSTPEQQNASGSSIEEATGDNSAATGLSQDAVVPRFIGTNQNEWTG